MRQELNRRWPGIFCFRWYPSSTNPKSAKGDVFSEGGVRWSWLFAGLIAFPCRRECLSHAKNLRSLGRIVNCFRGVAAHAPLILKWMITAQDEHDQIWQSPGTGVRCRWWEWCSGFEGKLRSEDPVNDLGFPAENPLQLHTCPCKQSLMDIG